MFGILSASTFQTLLDEVKVHVHVIFNNSYSLIFPIDQKTETPKDFTEKQIKTRITYTYMYDCMQNIHVVEDYAVRVYIYM